MKKRYNTLIIREEIEKQKFTCIVNTYRGGGSFKKE